ncbi:urease accessory protein UreE [Massilia sp. TSP1-1-2]|uniref:urease accessory protein UreE n=1 Tax=unclassified Massilia TaxID=2609279 RepID=UPI003CEBCBBD
MLMLHTKLDRADRIDGELLLPYDQREKCRLRARLVSGEEVALFTPRASVLRDGDLLTGADRRVIRVLAAAEAVYAIHCATPNMMARCAFHLGNRHTQVQIGDGCLRIRVDPVLRDMLEGLGARVEPQTAPFEPEAGAYSGAGHVHADHLLAPVPLRQKIHRPGDAAGA